jgi:hypothetical protein
VEKAMYSMALTTMAAGHSHSINMGGGMIRAMGGETSYTEGHGHPWISDEAGNITIGHAMGHNHGVEVVAKVVSKTGLPTDSVLAGLLIGNETIAGETNAAESLGAQAEDQKMTQQSNQTAETQAVEKQFRDEIAQLTKRAERAEQLADLSDAQRSFTKSLLQTSDVDAFLALSSDARDAEIAKAAETNKVVYTAADGTVYRKNDDARLIKMAQEMDVEKKKRVAVEALAVRADLEKRASELSHIPGDLEARVALLKGIDTLSTEERTKALTALKAQNERMSAAFARVGTSVPASDETLDPLDNLASEIAKRDGITFERAYNKALNTVEGQKLYNRHVEKRMGASV